MGTTEGHWGISCVGCDWKATSSAQVIGRVGRGDTVLLSTRLDGETTSPMKGECMDQESFVDLTPLVFPAGGGWQGPRQGHCLS